MASNSGLLAGRLALITGGGSGIGRAVSAVFAREGATVAVADLNEHNAGETVSLLSNASESEHSAFGINVASSTEVSELIRLIQEKYKAIPSIAVHSAGITKDNFLLMLNEKSFDDVISVNLKGTFLVNQALGKEMAKAKVQDGSIVNISSIVGKSGNLGQANYAASKAGVIGFTKTAAKELARYNLRVNAVLPGFIKTPMTDKVPENVMQMVLQSIPLQRMGRPEEIAEVCAFLASPKSSYITGAAIEVTGGLNM